MEYPKLLFYCKNLICMNNEYTMERTASMGPYLKTTYIIEGFVL